VLLLVSRTRNLSSRRFVLLNVNKETDHVTPEVLELSTNEESEEGLKRTSSKS
jgi:hypothetical protein